MAPITKLYSENYIGALNLSKAVVGLDDEYFVYLYPGSGAYGTAVVGRYTGSDIVHSTPVVYSAYATQTVFAVKIATNKIAVVYKGASGYPSTIVGEVSAGVITFGTPVALSASALTEPEASICYLSDDKYVATYADGRMRVCTVSGNTITAGTEFQESIGAVMQASSSYDGSRFFVAYTLDVQYVRVRSYNVSGSVITGGSTLTPLGVTPTERTFTIEALPDDQIMIFWRDNTSIRANLYEWVADGSALSFVTNTSLPIAEVYKFNYMFDTVRVSDTQINFAYTSNASPYIYYILKITTDGSTITVGTPVDMDIGDQIGLSQIDMLGNNTISTQGADFHIVATPGTVIPGEVYIGLLDVDLTAEGSFNTNYTFDGLLDVDSTIEGVLDAQYKFDGFLNTNYTSDGEQILRIKLDGGLDVTIDLSGIIYESTYFGKEVSSLSNITISGDNLSKIRQEVDGESSIL